MELNNTTPQGTNISDEQIIGILQACRPLATRLMSEGPNIPLESITDSDRQALEDFETISNLKITNDRLEELGRQAGLSRDVIAMLERLHNRFRVDADPMGQARKLNAYNSEQAQS